MHKCFFVLLIWIISIIGLESHGSGLTVSVPFHSTEWQKLDDPVTSRFNSVELVLVTHHDPTEMKTLQETVDRVSDPTSDDYGKYMTQDQIYGTILTKTMGRGQAIERWAKKNGFKVKETTKFYEFVIVEASADNVEQVFQTKLNLYQHIQTGKTVQRSESFQIPHDIQENMHYVSGLSHVSMVRQNRKRTLASQALNSAPRFLVAAGFSHYLFFILLVCSDGNLASNSLCNNDFKGYEINVSQIKNPYFVSVKQANCQVCKRATKLNSYLCESSGLSPDYVICNFYLNQDSNIPLYQPHTFSIRTKFTSGYSNASKHNNLIEKTIDMIPPTLRTLYNVKASPKVRVNNGSRQAVAEFGEYLDLPAFRAFARNFGAEYPLVFGKVYGSDYNNKSNDESEASLDTQYMASMGFNIPMDYISPKSNVDGFLIDFFTLLNSLEQNTKNTVPLVYSFSYDVFEDSLGSSYIEVCEGQFKIMALTGKTVFVSSGDYGAWSDPESSCGPRFGPTYPASSAYVTSVGATQVVKSKIGCQRKVNGYCIEEVVATISTPANCVITSGGGFSNFISQPSYQKTAVSNYLKMSKETLPPNSYFNRSNRAYPDISLSGHQYLIKLKGDIDIFADGTSASAPALAGLVSLAVDRRLTMGKKPLGLLNPLLYSIGAKYPNVFYDVTEGNNSCSEVNCCEYGYSASKGWDPTTGWGTINHELLMKHLIES